MTPSQYYAARSKEDDFVDDDNQVAALTRLDGIYQQLLAEQDKRTGLISLFRSPQLVRGLYLWGNVGIGKTFMMDCLYHCVPFPEKLRMHFHPFMQMVHHELKQLQGEKDPLQIIAQTIARKYYLLCFDELHVSDITDAMILARLLQVLFANGVCFVATSNSAPDDLYKNGLQRSRFLPAIKLLKEHTIVLHVPTGADYRLRYLRKVGVFYTPNDHIAHEHMEKTFAILAHGNEISYEPICIHDRDIPIIKRAEDAIWFDFNVICSVPRSQQDYLAIAQEYRTVFISNIPIIHLDAHDTAALFIRLVDIFYDAHVRLVFSAEKSLDQIYPQGYLAADFKRTFSRLQEMQSETYFSFDLRDGVS